MRFGPRPDIDKNETQVKPVSRRALHTISNFRLTRRLSSLLKGSPLAIVMTEGYTLGIMNSAGLSHGLQTERL